MAVSCTLECFKNIFFGNAIQMSNDAKVVYVDVVLDGNHVCTGVRVCSLHECGFSDALCPRAPSMQVCM